MSQHEIESLFKNMGGILEEVGRDPKGYQPLESKETEDLMVSLRQIQLEFAPPQLQYLASNFMIWFHGWKGKRVYAELQHIATTGTAKRETAFADFRQRLLD